MRLSDIRQLPPTLDAAQVAELLGVSVWSIYESVKRGTSPARPIHIGRRLVFPTVTVLRAIGIEPNLRDHDEPDDQL